MTIDLLHTLVHSLSKPEKRYCRLISSQQAGDKGFVRLFDCLLIHSTFGDALTADLNHQFPGTTLEPARKYLYKVVMRALRQFEQDKRIDVRISQWLHDSQILYDRGLVQAGQDVLERAMALAEQHERGLYAILVARQQIEQSLRLQFDGMDEGTLARRHSQVRQHLERTEAAVHHAALYETLLLRYHRIGEISNPDDMRRLNDLLLEEYQLLGRQKNKSFAMQQQHLHFQSAYFRMVGNVEGSLQVYRELDALFQRHTELWAEQPLYYVQLLEGILYDLRRLERYDEIDYFTGRLSVLGTNSISLQQYSQALVFTYTLLAAVDENRPNELEVLLQTHQQELAYSFNQLPLPTRTGLELALVRAEIQLNRLSNALKRLRRVLDQPVRSLPVRLYNQALLMNLLIHARLNNADYLVYAIRSASRRLKRDGRLNWVEALTLKLVQQWLNGRLTTRSLAELDSFAGTPLERQLVRDLDLRVWVKALTTS